MNGREIVSPCVSICVMEAGVCVGCFRTLEEITRWSTASDADKRQMLVAVALRRARRDADAGPQRA